MLVELPIEPIEIAVSDLVREGTIIKQKARYELLSIRQNSDRSTTVHLNLTVLLFAQAADGGYGAPLVGAHVNQRPLTLVADDFTAVDPQTGAIRYILLSESEALNFLTKEVEALPAGSVPGPAGWREWLDAKPEPLALQGRFFSYLRDNQDVRIRTLIEHHIQQADQMGRFS